MIEHLILHFDPNSPDGDPTMKVIFANDLAKVLYLGIKQGHITSQDFNKRIIGATKSIMAYKGEITCQILFNLLCMTALIGSAERSFAEELLPYVLGQKKFTWEVKHG
jgi:hypothetical protein